MSASIPLSPSGCCAPVCADSIQANVPGPKGDSGTNGTNGNNGQNAWTLITANFTVPAIGSSVNVTVQNSDWISNGQEVYVTVAGYYQVVGLPDSAHVTIKNLGYTGNAVSTTVIPAPQKITPSGVKGQDGVAVGVTLNSISPTTTKGDLIVDNGSNSPAASDVRFGVGTDGKALVADSSQPAGLNYKSITPNTVANDNNIPRFDGTSGTPMPLQDSKLLITDDGAIQSTPTGGNARGSKAVDLQVTRAGATQVASGARSGVLSGENNTAGATDSFVGGGSTNQASSSASGVCCGTGNTSAAANAFVGGGASNQVTGTNGAVCAGNTNSALQQNSFIGGGINNYNNGTSGTLCGGSANTVGGDKAFVGGGTNNDAEGTSSTIVGGENAKTNLYGQVSHAAGQFAAAGDAQTSELIWRIHTSDATPGVEMFLDGSSVRATVPLNTTWGFSIIVVGRSSAGVCAVWEAKGGIQNNANTVTLVAAITPVVLADGTGGSWGIAANFVPSADNTNKSLKLAVTGAGATNIRWTAHARMVEVNY